MTPSGRVPYDGRVAVAFIQSFRDEPAATDPPGPLRRDWIMAAIVAVIAAGEAIFRTDLGWPVLSMLAGWITAATLPWRRVRPLAVTVASMGASLLLMLASIALLDGVPPGVYAQAVVLINVYALFRWASGRDAMVGAALMAVVFVFANIDDWTGIGEAIGGLIIFLFPAELGGVVRYREVAKVREIEQVKANEREQIARELHDTVAHHVSAIAIQAQAGRTVAAAKPEAAARALEVIEEEASRTLLEMRSMVGSLRSASDGDGEAELAPQPGLPQLDELAKSGAGAPSVAIDRTGDLEGLGPTIETALYRITQESITNATRHAKNASTIAVRLEGNPSDVHLCVTDDGDAVAAPERVDGYGLVGMAERAELLGGDFSAGPSPTGGWQVHARLPRMASRTGAKSR